jgi:hypothetical protein
MSGALSSLSSEPLKGKARSSITVYDAFEILKANLPDNEYARHTLEGATIIASPSILKNNPSDKTNFDVHDSRYKLKIAQTVANSIITYVEDTLVDKLDVNSEVDRLLSLPVVRDYQGYGKRGMNLPFVVLQIYENVNEKKLHMLCRRIGEITEKGFHSFYSHRGYVIDKFDRPKDVTSYMIAEYESFTRIAAEISHRSRKLF